MTLIDDIVLLARHCEGHSSIELDFAAGRIMAAHNSGGLPRAIVGQAFQTLESRLVTSVREIAHEITQVET